MVSGYSARAWYLYVSRLSFLHLGAVLVFPFAARPFFFAASAAERRPRADVSLGSSRVLYAWHVSRTNFRIVDVRLFVVA